MGNDALMNFSAFCFPHSITNGISIEEWFRRRTFFLKDLKKEMTIFVSKFVPIPDDFD